MNIIFFSNPDFFGNQLRPAFNSMPRFTKMLADGMSEKGHEVKIWAPQTRFFNLPAKGTIKKWMGYIDQYILFPIEVRKRLANCSADTLFVFTDQAQGPWVPLVAARNHVFHCHDLLAQLSALGEIKENKTGWTGRQYQKYIRHGYSMGKHFISVSHKTKEELHKLLPGNPVSSNVVYNGLNELFTPYDSPKARIELSTATKLNLTTGYLLHVGGNQWYKNRSGVIEIYNAWRSTYKTNLPLLLIGEPLSEEITSLLNSSPFKADIHVFSGLNDDMVRLAYAGAEVFIFPSLAEGFGWPIAEAMASGCPVITTNEAPMTEVAGNAGFLIPRRPNTNEEAKKWALDAASAVNAIVNFPAKKRKSVIKDAIDNAKRFDNATYINSIESIYYKISNHSYS